MLKTAISLCSLSFALAANFGIPDAGMHPFAGILGLPRSNPICRYGGCGVTLVDSDNLFSCKAEVQRRIVITAGHCMIPADDFPARPFLVSFDATPALTFNTTVCGKGITSFTDTVVYAGSAKWSPYDPKKSNDDFTDFAIILLDEAISESAVPDPLPAVAQYPAASYMNPGPDRLQNVGFAGYGIQAWGRNGELLGKPDLVNGPRARMYVEQDVIAVKPDSVVTSMVAALEQASTCNGDSGSGMFLTQPDSTGKYTLLGTVTSGDRWCRANAMNMRVDTQFFRDYIASIDCAVCQKAGAQSACPARRTTSGESQAENGQPTVSVLTVVGVVAAVTALVSLVGFALWHHKKSSQHLKDQDNMQNSLGGNEHCGRSSSLVVISERPGSFRRQSLSKPLSVQCE